MNINFNKQRHFNKSAFSLVEVLISLLVLSGAIVTLFAGFETSDKLDRHSSFEMEAAFLAERELEILKSDLLSGKQANFPGKSDSRFRLKPGWKVKVAWTQPDKEQAIRLVSKAIRGQNEFSLESFLFLPKEEIR